MTNEADKTATFIGCQSAVAFAAATCPDCKRKGQVGVSTEAVVHKTMLCADCVEKSHDSTERPLAVVPTPESEMDDFWGFGG